LKGYVGVASTMVREIAPVQQDLPGEFCQTTSSLGLVKGLRLIKNTEQD
jgi:hypothetical protein